MFPQKNRLNSQEVVKLITLGKKNFSSYFRINYLKGHFLQCSVVIPKKIYKQAFTRNKERRRILSVCRNLLSLNEEGLYLIFLTKDIKKLDYKSLEKELRDVLKKIKLAK